MNALPPEEDTPSFQALQAAYDALLQEQKQLQMRVEKLEQNATKKVSIFSRSVDARTETGKPSKQDGPTPDFSQSYAWEKLLGVQGFAWLGVLAFLSGAGLFIRYAYLEGWLGPWSVLLSGLLLGATLLVTGNTVALRYTRYQSWAHALMGAGIALLYFLAYASYHFDYFQRVTHLNAFTDAILLMLIVAGAIALSLYRKSQTLASRAFVLGFFTSVLSTSFSELTLFYNLFLSLGLLGVVFKTHWHLLLRMGVLGSWALQWVWSYSNPDLTWGTHSILLLYTLLYGAAGLWQSQNENNPPEILAGMVNIGGYLGVFSLLYDQGAPYLWWIHSVYSLIALGLIYGAQRQHKLSAAYHGLLGLSLPVGFYLCLMDSSDRLQGLFLSLTALILYGSAQFLQQQKTGPVKLWQLYDSLSAACALSVVYLLTHTPYTAISLMGLSLFFLFHLKLPLSWQQWQAEKTSHYWGIAWFFHVNSILVLYIKHYGRISSPSLRDGALTLLLFVGFLWRKPLMKKPLQHLWLWPNSLAVILYSFALLPVDSLTAAWSILGALFVVSGFWLRETVVRYQGLAILACAGLKLLIYDLQSLSMGLRIISLFVIGSVLMALAWVYIRYEEHVKERA